MLLPVSLGTLAGMTLLHFYSAWPPSLGTQLAILASIPLGVGLYFVSPLILYRNVIIFLLSCGLGWGWAYYQVYNKLNSKPALIFISPSVLTGDVTNLMYRSSASLQFDLKINESDWSARLYWQAPTVALQEGEKITVKVKLKQPWSAANPGGFDSEKQFFIESVCATGNIIELIAHQPSKRFNLSYLRRKIKNNIAETLGNTPLVGVIQAITVGIRDNISTEEWRVFQATGTSHIVAISGLHIGLVAMLCANVVGFFVRRSYYLTSYAPAQCFGAIAAMLGAIAYSAAAGFSIPTQRACIMVIVMMLALLKRVPVLSWQSLAFAWLVLAIFSPFAPLQMGFWLSFGCVAALIMGRSHFKSTNRFRKWFLPQCVVFVALLPLGVNFFHQIPLFSPIANLLFLPIVSVIIVPFALLGTLGSEWCLHLSYKALALSWSVLTKIAALPWGLWQIPQLSFIGFLLASVGALLLLLPSGVPCRRLGWFGFLPLFYVPAETLPMNYFQLTLLDVGQGLAAVIQTKNHTLLYDAGPAYGETDAGQRIIQPFLKAAAIVKIDKIIISHSDLDHRGGLNTLHRFPHDEIITSEPQRLSYPARKCLPGEEWEWDGVHFIFLNPIIEHKKRNNISCVLKVTVAGKSALLTGDIEELAERAILKQAGVFLKSDVLLVPHHGSLTSSSQDFIEAVSPQYALFPVGKDNHYHFPRLEILRRYEANGIKSLLAWQTGAIIFQFKDEDELTPPIHWRDTFHHYWNSSSAGE